MKTRGEILESLPEILESCWCLILTYIPFYLLALHVYYKHRDENLYFVFEYMAGGSLYELMKRCIENAAASTSAAGRQNSDTNSQLVLLSPDIIRTYTRQILSGLSYIHGQGYIHRDIKPENILLHGNGRGCKVADFGLARQVLSSRTFGGCNEDDDNNSNNNHQLTYYVSTRWYRAPEVILRCPSYGTPIDIFATGLVFAELHSLRPLLPGSSEIDQLNKMMTLLGPPSEALWEEGVSRMKQLNFSLETATTATSTNDTATTYNTNRIESAIRCILPASTSPMSTSLIRQLIAWNPSSRLTAENAMKHEYFHPCTATSHAHVGDQSEMSKERELSKFTGIHTTKNHSESEVVLRHHHRHNVEEIVIERGGADDDALHQDYFQSCVVGDYANMVVSSVNKWCQFEKELDPISKPRGMEHHHHHHFLHNVGEIIVQERADDALQHECFQTTTLQRNGSSVRSEWKEGVPSEFARSRIMERDPDENAIPSHQFRHNVGEIVTEHRKLPSNAAIRKNNLNPQRAITMVDQQENEFCNYLDAISHSRIDQSTPKDRCNRRTDQPFGNTLPPIMPNLWHSTESGNRAPSNESLIDVAYSSAMQQSTQSVMNRTSTMIGSDRLRNAHHHGSSISGVFVGGRNNLHSRGRAALAEKPRWLLSHQNMGRGAMEVSIRRASEPATATATGTDIVNAKSMDWDHVVNVARTEDLSVVAEAEDEDNAGANPFACFGTL